MKEKFLRNPMASLCGIYALIVLAVFPLVFHDYYFDIVDVKYIFPHSPRQIHRETPTAAWKSRYSPRR